jgi:UPF0716 family protein affecting phage T7 exclusion
MTFSDLMLPALIAFASVVYGVAVGRANGARLRTVRADVAQGNARGYAVVGVVGLIAGYLILRGYF